MYFPKFLFGFQASWTVFKIFLGKTKTNINEQRHTHKKIIRGENLQDDTTMLELKTKGSTFYNKEIHCWIHQEFIFW